VISTAILGEISWLQMSSVIGHFVTTITDVSMWNLHGEVHMFTGQSC